MPSGESGGFDRRAALEIGLTCTYFRVRRATRILADVYDAALRPHGLKGTQFALLTAVYVLESAPEGATVGELASVLASDRTTLARTLTPLERDGLLVREPGEDRRERRVRLTERGRTRLAAASEAWRRAQDEVVACVGDAWPALMSGLRAVDGLEHDKASRA